MEIGLTLNQALLASLVITLAATVQGVIGYGVGVFGVPLLYLIYPDFVPAPMIVIGMLLPVLILRRDYRAVDKQDLLWAYPGMATGIIAAGIIVDYISQQLLGILLASLVYAGVALGLVRKARVPSRATISFAAALSGLMGTITAIGGPPLSLAFRKLHGPRLTGTLSAIFVPAGVLAITVLALTNHFGWHDLLLASLLTPGMLVGYWLSGALNQRLSPAILKPLVLTVSLLAASLILLRSLA